MSEQQGARIFSLDRYREDRSKETKSMDATLVRARRILASMKATPPTAEEIVSYRKNARDYSKKETATLLAAYAEDPDSMSGLMAYALAERALRKWGQKTKSEE